MIPLIEYYKLINLGLIFNKSPIIRFKKEANIDSILGKNNKLELLKKNIHGIENCDLKKTANKFVFSDGNINSKILFLMVL